MTATRHTTARNLLKDIYGEWWKKDSEKLGSIIESINAMPVKTKIEKNIKSSMYFAVLSKKQLLDNPKKGN